MEADIFWHSFGAVHSCAPVTLALHGFMGCGDDWRFLNAAERLLLCPDLPGHGHTRIDTVNAAAGMPEVAEALVAALHEHGHVPVSLIGYSMGGRIALYLATRHPQLFSCLVIISASPGLRTRTERRQRQEQDEALEQTLARIGDDTAAFEAFLRQWYCQPLFSTLSCQPVLFESLIQRRLENNPVALAPAARSMSVSAQPGLWEQLKRLDMPVLIITGERDNKYGQLAAEMVALLPDATHEIIPNASHAPHNEQPDLCSKVIGNFLRDRG